MASVFISYAASDRVFAQRLAQDIAQLGHRVWFDLWELAVGESLVQRIGEGLAQADYLLVVLSPQSAQSTWMEREVEVLTSIEITERRTIILPLVIAECVVPIVLRHKRFADFRLGYELGFAHLAITLHGRTATRNTSLALHSCVLTEPSLRVGRSHDSIQASCYTSDMVALPSKLSEVSVELSLPYVGKITGLWKPDAD
jgi:hypothetical protein